MVKKGYAKFRDEEAMEEEASFYVWWLVVWNSPARSKVKFFVWEVYWGRILTLDNLQPKGWSSVN